MGIKQVGVEQFSPDLSRQIRRDDVKRAVSDLREAIAEQTFDIAQPVKNGIALAVFDRDKILVHQRT